MALFLINSGEMISIKTRITNMASPNQCYEKNTLRIMISEGVLCPNLCPALFC